MTTKIEWTDESWNPVTGCTKISPGCANCYAERMAKRLAGRFGYPDEDPFRVTLHHDRLEQPLHWRKPRRVFVCSMSDFFHPAVPLGMQNSIFRTIRQCPQHTFQILTKRADQMWMMETACGMPVLPNMWLGVTAENQEMADDRIPYLLQTPAVLRFVSIEPMLELVGLRPWLDRLDWVIIGCESGPHRRSMPQWWAEASVDQCLRANVPVFVKQIEIDGRVSRNPAEWPEALRVRQYPEKEE